MRRIGEVVASARPLPEMMAVADPLAIATTSGGLTDRT